MKNLSFARAWPRRSDSPALFVLCSLLLASSAPLSAQTPAAPATPAPAAASKEDVVELSPFTVSGTSDDRYRASDAISAVRVRAPLIDTPSSISVITRDMMDDIGPNRVFDVTRYVAGVQEGRGIQFQDRMIIRGFETQNGARTVDNFLQSADADNIDQSVVDRIEVTKGPNAILSPAGAPGGSLNIITKSPSFRKMRQLTLEAGEFDSQRFLFDETGPIADSDKFAFRSVISGQDSKRYWANSWIKGEAFAPMFAWRITPKTLLTVKLVGAEHWISREPLFIIDPNTTATTSDPQLLPGISPTQLNGIQNWSHVETHSADAFATLTSQLNEHLSLRVATNARYFFENDNQDFLSTPGLSNRYNPMTGMLTQDYTWALQNGAAAYNATTNPYVATFSPWINPGNIPNRGQIQWTRRKTGNFQTDLAANYQFGDISTQTIAGLAWSHQTGYSRVKDPGPLPGIDLSHPFAFAYAAYPANLTANNAASYTNEQAYVNERLGFFNNKLYVTGGILYYKTLTQSWNALLAAPVPSVLDDNRTMWSLSGLYKVKDNISLYVSRSNNSSPVIANNQPLWRSGKQDEFGVKTDWLDNKLSLNVAYFRISQTNVTVPNPAFQTDPTQPQTLVSDLSNHGYEVELVGAVTRDFSIMGSYSHLHMRDALGRMVRAVADDDWSLLGNYHISDGSLRNLSINAGVTWAGKRAGDVPDGNFTQLNVVKQVSYYLKPQYTTTLGFSYKWNETITTRLIIDNVFDDKNYISVAGGRISGTGLATQPGRNIRFSTTLSF